MEERRIIEKPIILENPICSKENEYIRGKKHYSIKSLYDQAELLHLVPFDMPIDGINTSENPFKINSIDDFVRYARLTTSYISDPIILDIDGQLAYGGMIIASAMLGMRKKVKAYRLPSMPEPIYEETEY